MKYPETVWYKANGDNFSIEEVIIVDVRIENGKKEVLRKPDLQWTYTWRPVHPKTDMIAYFQTKSEAIDWFSHITKNLILEEEKRIIALKEKLKKALLTL